MLTFAVSTESLPPPSTLSALFAAVLGILLGIKVRIAEPDATVKEAEMNSERKCKIGREPMA